MRPHSGLGAPWFLGLPALLAAGAVCLPALYLLVRTLELGEAAWAFLSSARNLQILWNSAMLVACVTASSVALAVPLAWLTVRTDVPLRRFWSAVTPLPLVIPSYVGAYLFVLFLGEKGTLQGWLQGLGVERLPGIYGFFGAWLVLSLLCFPYVLLSLRAALWRMDPGLEESARSLGRSALQTFFRVTLPLLRPALLAGALLVALYTLSDFGAVSVLNYKTFTWAIYLQYGTINRALAAALSTVLVACTVLLLLAERRARGRTTYYRSGTGAGAPPKPVTLGRWRWPAFAFCALVAALALGVPLGVLLQWFLKGIAAGESIQGLVPAALNSLTASALAALAALAAALPVAILSVRYPSRPALLIERIAYIGFGLPGIVVALSLVFFSIHYARPLYQTLPMLILAYVVLFLPAAVGALRARLLQVNPNFEAAARGLGKTPWRAFAAVQLPLIRSGALAAGALVFLLAMKELPATLILGPTGFKTLATSVWSSISEAFYAQAAAPSLLLVLVSCGSLALMLVRERR